MATPETESKSRLMISHMKLVNFKSYAGTKIVGPFHKKFSAVVGPNGSGKSNVRISLHDERDEINKNNFSTGN